MSVALIYSEQFAAYRFGPSHPMQPERFTLAIDLARAWGLLDRCAVIDPEPASDEELLLVHDRDYLEHVKAASADPSRARSSFGLGPFGDTPAFRGMHEVSALIAGGTALALDVVLDGRFQRSFNPAGGLHHAQRERASGFCVYNDCAVAIERSIRANPGLRIAYVDIDAHHGDGVEAAFFERDDVLTVSVHESGRFLFPGTGTKARTGRGAGEGFAINAPLLPGAGDAELLAAIEEVVVPAVRSFAPDAIVAQLGADSHAGDPLTHLAVTTDGYLSAVRSVIALADEVCDGRLAATGGGGYQPYREVPIMWASALALLLGMEPPREVPEEWVRHAAAVSSA